uniref:Uncharacterized protein n=1 Tax=Leptobrachium leishanense TaxID=445787 RepID=A0A8C5LVY4_9ANUR
MDPAFGRLADAQFLKLLQCVRNEDFVQIRKFRRYGVPNLVNLTEPSLGLGVLHVTAKNYAGIMTTSMLRMGAHPDTQDKIGRTPAMTAAELGHDLVLEILANAKADMSIVDKYGKGILFYTLFPGKRHMTCFNIAVEHGADVCNTSSDGTPVFLAACEQARDCADMCLRLLEKGADPNSWNPKTGRTALMEASREGAVDLVRAILQKGGDVNQRWNAVHFAARGGYLEVLKVLSAYGADMTATNLQGNTALHCAAAGGFSDSCKFLGCNPVLKNIKNRTALGVAKRLGFMEALKELRKIKRLAKEYAAPGAKNPNPPWAVRLYDWTQEHHSSLKSHFEPLKKDDGTITKVEFVNILTKMMAPINYEQMRVILLCHARWRETNINPDVFMTGSKYLERELLASFMNKTDNIWKIRVFVLVWGVALIGCSLPFDYYNKYLIKMQTFHLTPTCL